MNDKATSIDRLTTTFTVEKFTKNTAKFAEDGSGPFAVGTLYVQKWAIAKLGKKASQVRVTIEAIGEVKDESGS